MNEKGRICGNCGLEIDRKILNQNLSVCPNCGYYMRFHAMRRIKSLEDKGTFRQWNTSMDFSNPFNDKDYQQKLIKTSQKHNLNDAIVIGEMDIEGRHVAIGVMDTRFMMASVGYIVGEKITILFEKATRKKLPVILFCCSGGARMQEGIIALMQMEKTVAAAKKHGDAGLLYISILTNPTMGGVTASFAMVADIILAEKGATIGFAGKRIIEQNFREKLPDGFQNAEFQMKHGFVDAVIVRNNTKKYLAYLLKLHHVQ